MSTLKFFVFCFLILIFIGGCGSNGKNVASSVPEIKSTLTETLDNYLDTDGQIVKLEAFNLMLQHHTPALLGKADYGYGWILAPERSDAFSHAGGHDGFRTWLLINRDKNLRMIIIGNGGDLTGDHEQLAKLMGPFL